MARKPKIDPNKIIKYCSTVPHYVLEHLRALAVEQGTSVSALIVKSLIKTYKINTPK